MHPLDRVNLALVMLAAVLAVWAWQVPRGAANWPPLTATRIDEVQELSLYADGQLSWRVQRHDSGWSLTHPEPARAVDQRVEQLLQVLTTPSLERFAVAEEELTRYGLDQPAFRLVWDGGELLFGSTEPTTGHRYVQADDQVHLIGDGYLPYLLGGADRLRAQGP